MTPSVQKAPRFSVADAQRLAKEYYGLAAEVESLPSERDQNFRLRAAGGAQFVLKIANAGEAFEILDLQNKAVHWLEKAAIGLEWPRILRTVSGNEIVPIEGNNGQAHFLRVLTWIDGHCWADVKPHRPELLGSLGRALAQMDTALAGFAHTAAQRGHYWDLRHADLARLHYDLLSPVQRDVVEPLIDASESLDWDALPASVIHADANDYNVLVDSRGTHVVSILDFGDMVRTATICELAVALAYVMLDEQDPIAAAAQVVAAYHAVRPLSEAEVDALDILAATRLAMSVCYAAYQTRRAPDNDYLNISNGPAWALLKRLRDFPAGWAREVFRRACGIGRAMAPAAIAADRDAHLGPSLSLSYRRPLHIIRGWREYMYDSAGRSYLDCVNNVNHVGHCHPRVTEAAAQQMALLNTNTRYLHENLAEYVERIAATLPAPLSVVYLVCSGSEANELALRLARNYTGRDEAIVVDTAYHGNTNALIGLSPYKFNGPGGKGKPGWVHVVSIPRPGDFGFGLPPSGAPAAFFCESALSCAGQVILPPGYLRHAYDAVHAAGGVCVADEVQTGFGRAGSHFWFFETQDVVPDIVTLGKPIGNGHPMAAVITTPEIAQSFANGMEYFNTFGGNPVSCAIGLAVLDIIRDERLQENARETGAYLLNGLRDLAARHPILSDVRGVGLFLGFDMHDPNTREPATKAADDLVNRMKDLGVLLSTDGPLHNVIKIKPPMVFDQGDACLLLDRLDIVLP